MPLTSHQLMKLVQHDSLLLFGGAPRLEAHVTAASFLVLSGEPHADLNVGGVLAHPGAEADLREIGTSLELDGLPAVLLLADEVAAELAPVAHELGLSNEGCMPLMVLEPATPPEANLEYDIRQVRDTDDLEVSNQLSALAFSLPVEAVNRVSNVSLLDGLGVGAYVAHREDAPMSSVWTTSHGSVVGIWIMGTPPEHQRQGAGQALLSHVIADHMGRGATQFFLGATPQGHALYERLGFVSVTQPALWVASLPGATSKDSPSIG